ncbi:rac GTPase-activating protein 1 isoform X2 [Syngnathus scovelli]|uniref:rac GTPase-activating protein 1 isoform X2 n=1 Tax=Syngnathus scovelli TaxID=161590 RepID=UPI0021109B6D|nr:rac GTPase-activating protein 1 isoform X2 [Syngnathus scovelli]
MRLFVVSEFPSSSSSSVRLRWRKQAAYQGPADRPWLRRLDPCCAHFGGILRSNRARRPCQSVSRCRGMAESRGIVEELLALCIQRMTMEEKAMNTELELIEVVKSFESARKQWQRAETELKKYKELLVKSDVAKAALEVKLKHARNQLDVEMRKRYKMEGDYQYLQRQMQLMCDILVNDSKSSACLNEEQKSLLAAFEHKGANRTRQRGSKRLSAIDESSFFSHSDISYDRTDDDVDLDTSALKPLRSRARERRRSSMPLTAPGKQGPGSDLSAELLERKSVEKEVETAVRAIVRAPGARALVDTPPEPERAEEGFAADPGEGEEAPEPGGQAGVQTEACPKHDFLSKTVIRPEMCLPCGKRIRFGRMALKCRSCRLLSHPECKAKCIQMCAAPRPAAEATVRMTSVRGWSAAARVHVFAPQVPLEALAPSKPPRIPPLLVECVKEIERRGLQERGLYRVPGGERQVKDLRQRLTAATAPPPRLSEVSDIHVLCGVLKDFLRKLKEPLLTFKLHRNFTAASEMSDHQKSSGAMFRAIAELPKPNRDTLAFLMLHLHKPVLSLCRRVMRSPQCQMDRNNLARVFGPTLMGHALSDPSPSTIVRDTNIQPKVIAHFLSFPEDYWRRVLSDQAAACHKRSSRGEGEGTAAARPTSSGLVGNSARFFEPLTSPELNKRRDVPGETTARGRAGDAANGCAVPGRRFFTSPS